VPQLSFLNNESLSVIRDRTAFNERATPIGIGVFFYWYFSRFHGLNPTDADWLLPFWNGNIDAATHYLGWEYFRSAPIFQWPLGKTPNLGPGPGSSIAMTDSIPLMAFIFKPFTHWYTGTFQYFGIWAMSLFVMQAVSAWKLLSNWIKDRTLLLLGTCFFVLSPAFLDRMTYHFALGAHWILLFGLHLYFQKHYSFRKWVALGIIATMVQPYLAMMTTGIFVAASIKNKKKFRIISAYFFACFFAAWQCGYFVFGISGSGSAGFGTYSANVLTLVDPGFPEFNRLPWSSVIPNVGELSGQYEGFAFVGVGVILVATVALFWNALTESGVIGKWLLVPVVLTAIAAFIRHDAFSAQIFLLEILVGTILLVIYQKRKAFSQNLIPLFIFLVAAAMFSFSNIIVIGDRLLTTYDLPSFALQLVSVARSSGRFIWFTMYLTIASVFYLICKLVGKRIAIVVLLSALVLQFNESRHGYEFSQDLFSREGPEESLISPLWNEFGSKFNEVNFVPTAHKPRLFDTNPDFKNTEGWLWRDISVLGQKYRWNVNSFYFGRSPEVSLQEENLKILERVKFGNYNQHVLYIFIDSEQWELAKQTAKPEDLVGVLDGVPVIAPGLGQCNDCSIEGFENRH
jgi:hypothetical protein